MDLETDPTEITEDGRYWLRAQRVTGYPRIARDTYFPKHGVQRPADVTEADLPETDDEAVAELDREALAEGYVSGKWQVMAPEEDVPALWADVLDDIEKEVIWDAKVATARGYEELPYDEYVITVYTPNYFETHDVERVRARLREEHGVARALSYKPDIYTSKGMVDENADEWGLERAARFRD
ncbi:hypothetical protein L593_01320 [Salinarchaeum sp. Harcht-Bsk1]|uniref:putative phosphothreonine lyase domain-containing protein n=1 Tax=Salinarchaeum sp. Harcht-Bsk1 TaxID=1333523 RepID=UPI0003423E95|nr:putative phosphothreonine lyase domain-containg protein [Salinarchaeum sp. Harcht-Bsk1]AGN00217.1 hypothetical protein L593_01320 [Salinarchaeum sp. Harcht-Bsk1]